MNFSRKQIAEATGGLLRGMDQTISGLTIDSREMQRGSMFVALRGTRDGHDFVEAARSGGATTLMVDRDLNLDGTIIVADTQVALQAIGAYARSLIRGPVVGVTGSAGKTSTKDLISGIFRIAGPTTFSSKSFNNELGVPLTLANGPDDTAYTVIEMGARGIGHIALLCEIAKPTIGVITNIGEAHRELFQSVETTAQAKGELVAALPKGGSAVLNFDDPMLAILCSLSSAPVVTFSAEGSGGATLVATNIVLDATLRPSFAMHGDWGSANVVLSVRGRHQVGNALCAAGAALSAGISLGVVVEGLRSQDISPWRMEFSTLVSGAVICNDAYNANPSAMKVALGALSELPATRKVAILGTMAELGDDAEAMHQEVMAEALRLGVDTVVSINEPRYAGSIVMQHYAEAVEWLVEHGAVNSGTAILVKGSRVAGLEQLVVLLHERIGVAPATQNEQVMVTADLSKNGESVARCDMSSKDVS